MPALRGHTAVDVYAAFMQSFKDEFGSWFGNTITECLIGVRALGAAQQWCLYAVLCYL